MNSKNQLSSQTPLLKISKSIHTLKQPYSSTENGGNPVEVLFPYSSIKGKKIDS